MENERSVLSRRIAEVPACEDRIMMRIARNVYSNPRRFGFKNEDEVGETLSKNWMRIRSLISRYADHGLSFKTYLRASLRYMALSMRREQARRYYRDVAFLAESRMNYTPSPPLMAYSEERSEPYKPLMEGRLASAHRERVLYLCVKYAAVIREERLRELAVLFGFDVATLFHAKALIEATLKNSFFMLAGKKQTGKPPGFD